MHSATIFQSLFTSFSGREGALPQCLRDTCTGRGTLAYKSLQLFSLVLEWFWLLGRMLRTRLVPRPLSRARCANTNRIFNSKVALHQETTRSVVSSGLVILFVAQILSAIMGLYTEATYQLYGPHWRENLFYSHLLSLPLFLPFLPSMIRNFKSMMYSEGLKVSLTWVANPMIQKIPGQLAYLAVNVLTQYACIRGVNLLAAKSSALTVTIVLNIRKLVSLLLSIWLFSNSLAPGTLIGAVIVFGAGALYSIETQPKRQFCESQTATKANKNT